MTIQNMSHIFNITLISKELLLLNKGFFFPFFPKCNTHQIHMDLYTELYTDSTFFQH